MNLASIIKDSEYNLSLFSEEYNVSCNFKQIPMVKGWRTDALFLQLQGWILRAVL